MSSELSIDLAMRAALVLVGLGVALHYFLMSNFIMEAPHWLRIIALPGAVGPGVGMVVCGMAGAVLAGMVCSLVASAAMVTIQLAAWHAGALVSEQFSKAAQFKRDKAAMIRHWVLTTEEFCEDVYAEGHGPASKPRREHVAGG